MIYYDQPIKVSILTASGIRDKNKTKPVKPFDLLTPQEQKKVEKWLTFTSIGVQILDTGTKMLKNLGVIHERDAVFATVDRFKQLRKHFEGVEAYEGKEQEIDDFLFVFLSMDEKEQKRVIKFQESINKK